jgi:hypothetical protein
MVFLRGKPAALQPAVTMHSQAQLRKFGKQLPTREEEVEENDDSKNQKGGCQKSQKGVVIVLAVLAMCLVITTNVWTTLWAVGKISISPPPALGKISMKTSLKTRESLERDFHGDKTDTYTHAVRSVLNPKTVGQVEAAYQAALGRKVYVCMYVCYRMYACIFDTFEVYVCMYVCMILTSIYVSYIHSFMTAVMHAYMHTYIHIYIQTYILTYYIHIYTHAHIHTHTHTHTHPHTHTHTHTHTI